MIIVNFATGHYLRGQQRLANSINGQKKLMFSSYVAINSPTHSESPYQFKVHAIEAALNEDPIVLWADASLYRTGDISKIENIIKEKGYFMEEAGHWVGSWCNHHTRNYFKLTEAEAKVPGGMFMFSAGLLGINRESPLAMEFFNQWKQSAFGGCFRGSWADHRHDMTCGSIIAQRLGMTYERGGSHMSYIGPEYAKPEAGSVFYLDSSY